MAAYPFSVEREALADIEAARKLQRAEEERLEQWRKEYEEEKVKRQKLAARKIAPGFLDTDTRILQPEPLHATTRNNQQEEEEEEGSDKVRRRDQVGILWGFCFTNLVVRKRPPRRLLQQWIITGLSPGWPRRIHGIHLKTISWRCGLSLANNSSSRRLDLRHHHRATVINILRKVWPCLSLSLFAYGRCLIPPLKILNRLLDVKGNNNQHATASEAYVSSSVRRNNTAPFFATCFATETIPGNRFTDFDSYLATRRCCIPHGRSFFFAAFHTSASFRFRQ